MNNIKFLGNKKTIIENPVNINNIKAININYELGIFTERPIFTGYIRFEKNNTSLSQTFKGDSLSDVYLQIYNFCNSL